MSTDPIPYHIRMKMAFLSGNGLTCRSIASGTQTSKSSVSRILQVLHQEQKEEISYDFSSQLKYHFVLFKTMQNPLITNNMIAMDSSEFEFHISESSVSRILNSLKIKTLIQKPKEKLNEKQKISRFNFCKNIQKTDLFLIPWSFSDETIIALEPMRKKVKIFPLIDNPLQFYDKQGYPPHIMVWACIAKDFKSPLIRIDGKLNAKNYIKMLKENHIIDLLNERFGQMSYVFQQDGASAHRAIATKDFLINKVKLLLGGNSWPANSPDLNVIEHLWAIIKAKIDISKINDLDDLFKEAQKVWDSIPIDIINNLIASFNERIKACMFLYGESLNGKKKFIEKIKTSFESGQKYLKEKNVEIASINQFIKKSRIFFNELSKTDLCDNMCNQKKSIPIDKQKKL